MSKSFDVQWCRNQFPALATEVAGQPAVFFDGPAGSQVPRRVIEAVAEYLTRYNGLGTGAGRVGPDRALALQHTRRSPAVVVGAGQAGVTVSTVTRAS